MKRRDHLRAFADGSGNALDRSRAHVADREDAGQTGFERPLHVHARADKALVVERHARPRQPVGIRLGTDEQKQMTDRALYFFTGSVRATADCLRIPSCPSRALTVVWARTSMFGIEATPRR